MEIEGRTICLDKKIELGREEVLHNFFYKQQIFKFFLKLVLVFVFWAAAPIGDEVL